MHRKAWIVLLCVNLSAKFLRDEFVPLLLSFVSFLGFGLVALLVLVEVRVVRVGAMPASRVLGPFAGLSGRILLQQNRRHFLLTGNLFERGGVRAQIDY